MAFCRQCGSELQPGLSFCTACGTPVDDVEAAHAPGDDAISRAAQGQRSEQLLRERAAAAGVSSGFSTRIDSAEFQEAMGKGNRTFTIAMILVALLLAPAIVGIAAVLSPNSLGVFVVVGAIVEIIVVILVVRTMLKRFAGKSWDGEVIAQLTARERSGNRSRKVYITEFAVDGGGKKKQKESVRHPMYDYLAVGDRVRYHPQLTFPYEKYDKTADANLLCPFCGNFQPIENDYCDKCNKPLLK